MVLLPRGRAAGNDVGTPDRHARPTTGTGGACCTLHFFACPERGCREGHRQMSMSYVSGFVANVATRHDMNGPGSLANVATYRNVSSLLLARGPMTRFGGRKTDPNSEIHFLLAESLGNRPKMCGKWQDSQQFFGNNLQIFSSVGPPQRVLRPCSPDVLANVAI